jgi:hypothetical protein
MDKDIIQGRHFRIGTIHVKIFGFLLLNDAYTSDGFYIPHQDPPYIIIERTGRNISHANGFVHQIVAWLAEKHQFTYEYYSFICYIHFYM